MTITKYHYIIEVTTIVFSPFSLVVSVFSIVHVRTCWM